MMLTRGEPLVSFKSFVIPYPDVVAGRGEWIPGDVEPAIAREQLVGVFADLQEFDELPELRWIFRTDVGSLAEKVLGIADTPYLLVDFRIAEARVDDERSGYDSCRFEQQMAAIGQIDDNLHRRDVLRVFLQIEKLPKFKVRREPHITIYDNSWFIHGNSC